MFEKFTESAIKSIMHAQEESRRLGHNFVGTEQILLGLIRCKGVAASKLAEAGVSLREARVEVEKIIGRGNGFVAVEIPFTVRAKGVLELSWKEACRFKHNYIGTEHILLGLLRQGDGVACRVLDVLKVDRNKLRDRVLEAMGKDRVDLPDTAVVPKDTANMESSEVYSWYMQDAVLTIQRAWGIADTFGADVIGAEHLCLALLRDRQVIQCMGAENIDLSVLRGRLVEKLQSGKSVPLDSLPFSPEATAMLTHAWSESVAYKLVWVTTEALLLGALKDRDGTLSQTMQAMNADPGAVAHSLGESIAKRRNETELSERSISAGSNVIGYQPASPKWLAGLGFVVLIVSALFTFGVFLIDQQLFVTVACTVLLICFVLMGIYLFRKAADL